MNKRIRVLVVEDSMSLAMLCASYLGDEDYDVTIVDSLAAAEAEIERLEPQLVLLDVGLPDGNGLTLLDDYPPFITGTEIIVMTAHGSSESAIDAIGRGAFDYLEKPFDADRLRVTVNNALAHHRLNATVTELKREGFCDFIGNALPMQSVYRIIESVAPSDATVFITGESGTGKEVAASAVHQLSKRKNGPFHAINCGAIPKDLIESALFGHVKGAFTGAAGARSGAASIADGGTLFLDEICEMDLELQTKLLRFIQTGEFQRVGSDVTERVDVRFVCATNRDPLNEVREGRFREDLYYRLHVVPISLPPLRERGEDVISIAEHFLTEFSDREDKSFTGFGENARDLLMSHLWPGNVRELQNIVQNAVVLNEGDVIDASMLAIGHLPERSVTRPVIATVESACAPEVIPLWQVERDAIEQAIQACNGNITRAAALLEVSPSTIYRKQQAWQQERSRTQCTA